MKILFVNCLPKKNLFIVFTLIWAVSSSSVFFFEALPFFLFEFENAPLGSATCYCPWIHYLCWNTMRHCVFWPIMCPLSLNSNWIWNDFKKGIVFFLYFVGFTFSCNWFRWYKTNWELCVSILVSREKALSKKLAILLINVIKSNSKLEWLRLWRNYLKN